MSSHFLFSWHFINTSFICSYVLHLHNDVAPYQVGILNESTGSEQQLDLEDLRRLICLKLNQSRIPVVPLANPWTVSQCDARGVPYLVVLADETLNHGICHIRSRNTSLKVHFYSRLII